MADEALAKAYGLHFDELNKIRVLEPEVAQQTNELKEECKDFVDSRLFLLLNIAKSNVNCNIEHIIPSCDIVGRQLPCSQTYAWILK